MFFNCFFAHLGPIGKPKINVVIIFRYNKIKITLFIYFIFLISHCNN